MDDLVLHLGREPPQTGQLHAPLLAREVAASLGQAADGPLDVAHQLPEKQARPVDVAACRLVVTLQISFHRADSAQVQRVLAEAPRPHERPREVLHRVAHVRKLPVDHPRQALGGDQEVANPVITVHHHLAEVPRGIVTQPPEAPLDRRVWLSQRVDLLIEAVNHPRPRRALAASGEEGELALVDGVDLRELVGHLLRELRARRGQLGGLHDLAADALTRDSLHHERFATGHIREIAVRAGGPDARFMGREDNRVLVLQRESLAVDHPSTRPADKERERSKRGVGVDRPRFLGGAAGDHRGATDGDRALEEIREGALQGTGVGGRLRVRRGERFVARTLPRGRCFVGHRWGRTLPRRTWLSAVPHRG